METSHKRRFVAAIAGLTFSLAACDKLYSYSRTAKVAPLPTSDCVEAVLSMMKVTNRIDSGSRDPRFYSPTSGLPDVVFRLVDEGKQQTFEQSFNSIGPTYPEEKLRIVRDRMKSVEQEVIASCGARLLEPPVFCDMSRCQSD
jgi:hypothetical protein